MAATSCCLQEEQFLCCICLDVFTDPVTIPCGHNFCKMCITKNWNVNSPRCQCPMCKQSFTVRPELRVNTFVLEMASEFKQATKRRSSLELQTAKPGEIPCDICTGKKLKAVKSCLTCFASYCSIHLDPHETSDRLKTHTLSEPVENMEARMCSKHKKPLELFCRNEQLCVCSLCCVTEHAAHDISSISDEWESRRTKLQEIEAETQQMIRERQLKSQQIERLKNYSREDSEREIASSVRVFTIFMQTAEKNLNRLLEVIEERQRRMEQEADGYIRGLQEEISVLGQRTAELQKLSQTQDHLLLLQKLTGLNSMESSTALTDVNIRLPAFEGVALEAVVDLEKTLSVEKERLLHEERLKKVQQYSVDVVLEAQTANPYLILSEDGKQVRCGEVRRDLTENEERFSLYASVLGQQTFSFGRFYFEVQVTGKTDWTLGVAKGSVDRKGIDPLSPVNGYWAIGLRGANQYLCLDSPAVSLNLNWHLERLGVFVSYEEGLVSFFDVDKAVHLYSFTDCVFTEDLRPFFSPGHHKRGMNSAPLIISVINRID
ncbi:E3 ubiquitin-protein ligase TRIM21 [Oryzias melastigma]|uniref:E3 ubiquitin-protein ligase TRIM21 n=1 Tax=Oryzias melastigma TaxID=30732 RepID=A0A3B3CZX5_ORYME|nr:E3 ubiquitin-protein ligase TRIM21 [Oryzias melastigma]KAF6720362.1 E3 ubiquitin-protein ligase TRIM21 [Oryzias melastigma]